MATEANDYLFDNEAKQAGHRFGALASLFDPVTVRHLDEVVFQRASAAGKLARAAAPWRVGWQIELARRDSCWRPIWTCNGSRMICKLRMCGSLGMMS